MVNKVKSAAIEMVKYCAMAYNGYMEVIEEYAKMVELYNAVYSLSSRACAESVSDSARRIAYARPAKNVVTYTEVMEEAIRMLSEGMSQQDVVYHFDMEVAKEYGVAQ